MMYRLSFLLFFCLSIGLNAQYAHEYEGQKYYPEDDPLVLQKIEDWQDLKFGLLMHWGTYSQWGIVESWSICPEDYDWCRRISGSNPGNYFEYVKEYEALQTTFNPVKFDPDKWAKAAKKAGMKYMVFTTKHHDGYSMFDSKYTDYKITGSKSPFKNHKKANITKEIFKSFRNEGLWTGAYFSKPDWHSDDYWWSKFPPLNRNVNYDPALYPEKWEKFVQFTHNQILELMTDYGAVDILWLDGGWVSKKSEKDIQKSLAQKAFDASSGFLKTIDINQDIRMDELVDKAREKQPGLIVVDRAVEGVNQNYLTPENRVPEHALPYFPWESCIIAGGSWSYIPEANYLSGTESIHMLVDIVAKGGNLLYNIAPGPDGAWHKEAYELLEKMGNWININGEGIYGTRAVAPFLEGNLRYTRKKDSNTINAFYLVEEDTNQMPAEIFIPSFSPKKGTKVSLLGSKTALDWRPSGQGAVILIPKNLQQKPASKYAWCFSMQVADGSIKELK